MTQAQIYDCIIIGGGLAGLSTAILLADQGWQVAVVEKKTFPHHKVCGEYISMESWDFVRRLGVPLENMDLPRISRLHISSPSGKLLAHPLGLGGFGVSRYTLDASLAKSAETKGVTILQKTTAHKVNHGSTWEVHTSAGVLASRTLIGAFGKRSQIDMNLDRKHVRRRKSRKNLTNFLGIKYHIQREFPSDLIELHNFKDGYCGISRVEGNATCLCYLTTGKNLALADGNIQRMESEILHKNPHLKKYFTQSEFLYKKPLSISQVDFNPKEITENQVLMAGDAAGLIAPLCGNGMSMAFRSASILAPLMDKHLRGDLSREQMEVTYVHRWKKEFRLRLRAGRTFQALFGNELLTEAVIGLLRRMPFVTKGLIRMTHGQPF